MKLTSKKQTQFWFSWDEDSEQRKTLTNKEVDIKTIENTDFFFYTKESYYKTPLDMIK